MSVLAPLVHELVPAPGPSKCTQSKLKETGDKAGRKLDCYAKAVANGHVVDGGCLSKAEVKFSQEFADAEDKGDCLAPTGDTAAIEAKVDAFVSDLFDELAPGY